MEYGIGVGLSLAVIVFARMSGFDKERAFYPVILVVVASYYGLFAVQAGSVYALSLETLAFGAFVVVAVIGFKTNLWIVAVGLVAHGVFDFIHADLISNPGVPIWWPMFCATFDVVAGGYLAWRILRRGQSGGTPRQDGATAIGYPGFRRQIRPYVDQELIAASTVEKTGDPAAAFRHLERAHVLGQASTIEHVRVHMRMFAWGLRRRDPGELVSQVLRIIGAATLTALKGVPHGNTGGSNVSAFRSMPIPSDLAAIIAGAAGRVLSVMFITGTLLVVGACDGTPKDVRFATSEQHSIAYRVLGTGQPVIVMISGLGDGMESFEDVAPELAKNATVIVYDRAGYGASGRVHGVADAAAADRDLTMMLAQSGVPGPYVLVGHSVGGLFAEYFAAKHPEQVGGLILAESRPADFTRRCEAARTRPCLPPSFLVKFMAQGAQAEFAARAATNEGVEAEKPVEGKAVLVLSRSLAGDAKPIDRLWSEAQADLAARYAGSRHVTAPGGGHNIHHDQAEWFVAFVRAFLAR